MGLITDAADAFERLGSAWAAPVLMLVVHAALFGGLAVFALWPEFYGRMELTKILYTAALVTLPFDAAGAGVIYLGAMDYRPRKPQIVYSICLATGFVAVCQLAALWNMFVSNDRSGKAVFVWGVVGAVLCLLPAYAKRHETEEEELDRREGRMGKKSFFRGKRMGKCP